MSRFSAVDLSKLPPPEIIENLDYEIIFQQMLEDAVNRLRAVGIDYNVNNLETDPLAIVLQAQAYREVNIRQRVNDGIKATLLAYSWGSNLDHLGAYLGVERAEDESDDRLRERIQLAIEAFSTAGPYGAYRFYALSASPLVRDVAILGPESGLVDPGQVGIWVLTAIGNGEPEPELTEAVYQKCNADDVRPLTDQVLVHPAEVENYQIQMSVQVPRGPDAEVIRALVQQRVDAYVTSRHGLGKSVALAGIIGAGMAPEVINVTVEEPIADIEPGEIGAAYCTAAVIDVEIVT